MIYFDNMASTKVCIEAQKAQIEIDNKIYGNPSALSKMGAMAEEEVKKASNVLALGLKVRPDEIIYTSSATESNNMFIFGVAEAYKRKGKHIITQKTEHPSVLEAIKKLENQGFDVTYLDVNEKGQISLEDLKNSLKEETILISIMHVNNETGVIMPIKKITEIVKEYNKEIKIHVDGVQSFGKLDVNLMKLNVDGYSFSGHKIHAPKGVGGLFVKSGTNIQPLIIGGKQQNKKRAGTLNTSGIVALSKAFELSIRNQEEDYKKAQLIKNEFLSLKEKLEGVVVNGDIDNSSPYTLNLTFEGIRGEVLLHALSDYDIYISTGTSCSRSDGDGMLYYYGFNEERVLGSIRIGISRYNTIEETKIVIEKIESIIPMLRRFKRR